VARLLAQIVFGESRRGRQVKDWTEHKLVSLGSAYASFRLAVPASEVSDAQFAKEICEQRPREYGKDEEAIRQRLPAAKRLFKKTHCDPEVCGNPGGPGFRVCERCF
jgi:hypothetical protein